MSRPILSLWPYLWRVALPLLCVGVCLLPFPWLSVPLLASLVGYRIYLRRMRWLWPFARAVRSFRTITEGRFVLHHAPELADRYLLPILLQRIREEHDRVAKQFGFRLRGRIVVYLFADGQDVARLFGPLVGGAALWFANAIVIADNSALWEMARHEFGHLFSFRWSRQAPPLLDEGLSVWLQQTWGGQPISSAVQAAFLDPGLKLPLLLDRGFFFAGSRRWACYLLAGSFTGFLIRRYGWERYRQLYRRCNGFCFPAKFKKVFGITLEQAEEEWRRLHDRGKVWIRGL